MIVLIVLLEVALGFLGGWFFMLGVGVMHHDWVAGLPTVGYWPAVMIVMLFRLAFSDYGLKDALRS